MVSEEQEEFDPTLEERRRTDARSVFIQNVDYKTTIEELDIIFQDCGTIDRITILKNPITKAPKGCAYVSFKEEEAVRIAILLTGTKLRGRVLQVQHKRTNIAGKNKRPSMDKNQILNGMMWKLSQAQGNSFRGKPRGRGR
jgi:polyadenylate-binding protein 2